MVEFADVRRKDDDSAELQASKEQDSPDIVFVIADKYSVDHTVEQVRSIGVGRELESKKVMGE